MINSNNCIVGGEDHLLKYLNDSFKKAKSVDIIVSFLMESGVRLLKEELEGLLDRNIPLRILTGNYLNITQPSALYLLKEIMGENVDLRFYNVKNKSFHPKANIITYEEYGEIFIGSSNMSASALTTGIEWNYRLDSRREKEDFNCFKSNFEDLFLNHSIIINDEELRKYSKQWKKPKFNINAPKEIEEDSIIPQVLNLYEPRGAQIEALYELEKTRQEGFDKGLVVAATGERVIIVTGCINALRSRVSGTLVNMIHALLRVIKYNYCKQCMRSKDVLALQY